MTPKIRFILFSALIITLLAACAGPINAPETKPASTLETKPLSLPKIDRHPVAADYSFMDVHPKRPKKFDPKSGEPFQNDYRSSNLSKLDLSPYFDDLLYSDFDTSTVWPSAERMPVGFDPDKIMELGKDPGLGVRQLHAQGITGAGVSIAIIDQPMLVDHQEYASQLKLYEEINVDPNMQSQMHGPAVASIAVGKTVGVAPQADLYFIADWFGKSISPQKFDYDFSYLAQGVRRILEINRTLSAKQKIRVISISVRWRSDKKGYEDMVAAVNEAKKAGIFVVSMSIKDTYGWNMLGMGRNAFADPNDFNSYTPSLWQSEEYYQNPGAFSPDYLFIPMDARTTAGPTSQQDYAFGGVGGISWTAPYVAGVYALACQVDPEITPEQFWSTALQTGKTIQIEHDGKQYSFGVILDPQNLIAALQNKKAP